VRGWEGKRGEERGMGACTHWDFRKSAPMLGGASELPTMHCPVSVTMG